MTREKSNVQYGPVLKILHLEVREYVFIHSHGTWPWGHMYKGMVVILTREGHWQ